VTRVPLAVDRLNFARENNPAFQGAVELLAVTVALFVLIRLGFKDTSVHLEGDSTSALTWAATRCFRQGRSFHSACAQMLLSLNSGVSVSPVFSRLSVRDSVVANYDADLTSRGGDTGDMEVVDIENRYPEELLVSLNSDPWIVDVLDVCNREVQE